MLLVVTSRFHCFVTILVHKLVILSLAPCDTSGCGRINNITAGAGTTPRLATRPSACSGTSPERTSVISVKPTKPGQLMEPVLMS